MSDEPDNQLRNIRSRLEKLEQMPASSKRVETKIETLQSTLVNALGLAGPNNVRLDDVEERITAVENRVAALESKSET